MVDSPIYATADEEWLWHDYDAIEEFGEHDKEDSLIENSNSVGGRGPEPFDELFEYLFIMRSLQN